MHAISANGGLDEVAKTDTHWVRRNALSWSRVEKVEGAYDWNAVASLEQEMINASQDGMRLVLIVRSTPDWAQLLPGVSCGKIKFDALYV